MKYDIQIGKAHRAVEIEALPDGAFRIQLDGQAVAVDAVESAPGTYSILLDGHAVEASVSDDGSDEGLLVRCSDANFRVRVSDPRSWRGARHTLLEAHGPQRILAPMPGKVVRVLVGAGDQVEAGRGLIVVEAMKMQNEIRSPKSGKVEKIFVKEGQAVNAGEVLAWVD